jgi:hypothetical protein
MALSEAQSAWLDLLDDVYPNTIEAIGEPYINPAGAAEVQFQDGKKLVQFTLLGDPPDRYESKILNPEEI